MLLRDSNAVNRHTMMLSRYRDAKYQRKFTADSIHKELHINMYYHPKNEESKRPGITIRNLTITRVLPTEQAVDSLFDEQMGPILFNHALMTTTNTPTSGNMAKRGIAKEQQSDKTTKE